MSWLARSIANSLQINDEPPSPPPHNHRHTPPEVSAEERESDGVKEDLTVFKESLTRQLWGVANFLAPPAPPPPPLPPSRRNVTDLTRAESNSGDEEFEKDDRDQIGVNIGDLDNRVEFELRTEENEEEDWGREVAGLTEEVLTFAGNVAHHPETWLDFPIDDDEYFDDFPMSESQKTHTRAVEHLTPRLAALRIELCPAHMSIGFFWKVYFVLLHSRLNKQDADLLSTPEIVEARAEWMQELQKRAKKDSERYHGGRYGSADFDEDFTPTSLQNDHSETHSSWTFASEPATSSTTADSDTEKHVSNDIQYTERSAITEKPLLDTNYRHNYAPTVSMRPDLQFDDDVDDDDDWPEDDCLLPNGKVISVGIDEDISFSDLEDDDCCIPVISKPGFQV